MKNSSTTLTKMNVKAMDEIVRSSLLSESFPANDETNTTARGVASKNSPVKRAYFLKALNCILDVFYSFQLLKI